MKHMTATLRLFDPLSVCKHSGRHVACDRIVGAAGAQEFSFTGISTTKATCLIAAAGQQSAPWNTQQSVSDCLQDGAPFSVKMKALISVVAQLSPSPPCSPIPQEAKLAGGDGAML